MNIGIGFILGLVTGWLLILLYKIIFNKKSSSITATILSQNTINEVENIVKPDPIVEALSKTIYK